MKLPSRLSHLLSLTARLGSEDLRWEVVDPPPGAEGECLRQLFQAGQPLGIYAVGAELSPVAKFFVEAQPRLLSDVSAVESLCSDALDRIDWAAHIIERVQRRAYAQRQREQYFDLRLARGELAKALTLLRRDRWFDTQEEFEEFQRRSPPEPDPFEGG